ncbi:sugar ABC transporter ATP-binding protein (plasmid) [Halostagnicola larsenii XH-48]|uniref:ABC-type D-xylose/L-arabinose transporter n=1 Tax=Halostagnicola larsenii XH-48 TaxID=797299 RepID=W0JWR9_9EURY|nr:ABC transporter ATP-binding protein [Halostagnicola larsenii]AHG01680.1 sugar ABC transporter ATP-binding protein [Halostagnicola larsenii XH-48]
MERIQLDRLTKQFGEEIAVEDVTLEIEDGEFLVLVGPSGCGKSTTLRMIAGLETPTAGNIYIDGDHMNYRVPQNRDIAMVFQSYALYPHMTVRENVRFGLEEEAGYTADEMDERVVEVAEDLGIEAYLERKPADLSGGQQQRVALGRAIIREPSVFLMDEPLANLDAKLRTQMRTELQRLQADLDVTTVYVTHNQVEAMTMGDRIAVLNDGQLQQVGDPMTLYHEPANQFVAGFIGEPSMNFVSGHRSNGKIVGDHIEYPLDDRLASAVDETDGGEVVVGIRPEAIDIRRADDGSTSGPHEFRMTVRVIETHGDRNVITLAPASESADHEVLQVVTDGTFIVDAGETVVVTADPDAVHIFDGMTGEALCNRRLETEHELRRV